MNNTVENDLFGFPKVKWLHLTGDVDKSVRFFYVKYSQAMQWLATLPVCAGFIGTANVTGIRYDTKALESQHESA